MTNTTQNLPGDLAYLPQQYRNHVELSQKQLGEVYGVTRETVRSRHIAGELPPKLPNRPLSRPKWLASVINEHLRRLHEANLAAQANTQKA